MKKSYSKIKHIQDANERMENRLMESKINNLIKRIVKEDSNNMCVADKPDAGRPLCSEVNISSGNLMAMGDQAFLQYKDEANCPKLCKVENNTSVTIA